MNYSSSMGKPLAKIRVQVTLTEQLSKQLQICRTRGLSDSSVVESALVDYFAKIGV